MHPCQLVKQRIHHIFRLMAATQCNQRTIHHNKKTEGCAGFSQRERKLEEWTHASLNHEEEAAIDATPGAAASTVWRSDQPANGIGQLLGEFLAVEIQASALASGLLMRAPPFS